MELRSNFIGEGQLVQAFENTSFVEDTILHVRETENAVFVKDGEILEVFSGGRHTLIADKYPFLAKIARKVASHSQKFGRFLTKHNLGGYEYTATIYFIDKGHKLNILWGTDSPIPMRDYEFGFAVSVRANGTYTIKITDASLFIKNFIGNMPIPDLANVDFLRNKIKSAFLTKVKSHLAKVMRDSRLTVLDMASELSILSEEVKELVTKDLEKYGIGLEDFYIVDISIPDNDPNYEKINTAYADKAARKINDISWGEEKQHELMMSYVNKKRDSSANPNEHTLVIKQGGNKGPIDAKLKEMVTDVVANNLVKQEVVESRSQEAVADATQPQDDVFYCQPDKSRKVKYCTECGQLNMAEAKFCSACGHKL